MYVFFFNDTATTEIYTLSLHDALPIYLLLHDRPRSPLVGSPCISRNQCGRYPSGCVGVIDRSRRQCGGRNGDDSDRDRKSTRLNSSHTVNSYAVFCLINTQNKGQQRWL